MAERLLDNFYQIGGESLTHPLDGASYLLLDENSPEKSVMVDCGSPLGFTELTQQLGTLGLKTEQIANIYATHCHFDHVSAASMLGNACLNIHQKDLHAVKRGDFDLTAAFLYKCDFPKVTNVKSLKDQTEIEVGGSTLKAIHTPGHTPGSVSYKVTTESGACILIGSDTLWGGYEPRIHSDANAWKKSLDRLSKDTFDYVTFGHGINYLIPDAMAHIALAQSRFMMNLQPSHGGEYFNPWIESAPIIDVA